jgi:hypothetical protein
VYDELLGKVLSPIHTAAPPSRRFRWLGFNRAFGRRTARSSSRRSTLPRPLLRFQRSMICSLSWSPLRPTGRAGSIASLMCCFSTSTSLTPLLLNCFRRRRISSKRFFRWPGPADFRCDRAGPFYWPAVAASNARKLYWLVVIVCCPFPRTGCEPRGRAATPRHTPCTRRLLPPI